MRKRTLSILVFLLTSQIGFSCIKVGEDNSGDTNTVARKQVPFGYPFIMLYNVAYYAYGTYAVDGILVYVSD